MVSFWKNLGLNKKIIFAVGLIVLSSGIMAGFLSYSTSILSSSMDVVERADKVAENMFLREIDHLQWVNALQSFVFRTDQTELTIQTNPALCAFGKWYSSEHRMEAESVFPKAKPFLAAIDEPHRKLHQSADAIAALRHAGKQKELDAFFAGTTLKNLEAIKGALLSTRKAAEEGKKNGLAAFAGASRMVIISILGGTSAVLLLSLCAALLLFRSIGRPIGGLVQYANAVAGGNYAAVCSVNGRDEFGQLSDGIRHMVKNMVAVIARAEEHAREAEDQSRKATEALDRAEQFRQEAEQATRKGIREAAASLESIEKESGKACGRLAANVPEALRGAEKQLEYAASLATAMVQISESIITIANNASAAAENSVEARENAECGAGIVHSTIEAIEDMHRKTASMQESMRALGKQVEGIGHVMSVISDIADQTNLLALNAAIEAARAGEAGRGFAVVADEVRKLAEKTMLATKEVSEVVTGIQKSAAENITSVEQTAGMVEQSTDLARRAGESLAQIVRHATDAEGKIGAIAASSEEQSTACGEINKDSDEIRRLAEGNSALMRDAVSAMRNMNRLISDLAGLLKELRNT